MNRRTLLVGIGCGMIGLSGCMSSVANRDDDDTDRDDSEYDSCDEDILSFGALPEEVKKEVRTAFDEGEYQTRGQLLYAQVEGSGVEALERNERYYKSKITERQQGKSTLSFEETDATLGSVIPLRLRNVTEETWEGTVTATDIDGNQIVDEEVTVESFPLETADLEDREQDKDRITEVPLTDKYGEYEVSIGPIDGETKQTTIRFRHTSNKAHNAGIEIHEDKIDDQNELWGLFGEAPHPSFGCGWDCKKLTQGKGREEPQESVGFDRQN